MKLQTRLALLLLATVALFAGGILVIRQVAAGRADLQFRERSREKAALFDRIVELKGASLATMASDYTYWDEMVAFVHSRDEAWAAVNLADDVASSYGVDALWVYADDGSPIYAFQAEADGPALVLPGEALSRLRDGTRFCHFFVATPRGFLEVRGATIHPSVDSERRTPPQGSFFVGRLWTEDYRSELEDLTETAVRLRPAGAAAAWGDAGEAAEGVVEFSRTFPGWDGAPLLALDARSASPAIRELYRSARIEVLLLALCALGLTFALGFFLLRWVSRPLQRISKSLASHDPGPIQELLTDKAEFGQLARVVQGFFEQRGELVREIHERTRAEERLRHDNLHDPLTGLANRVLFMERLRSALARARRRNEPGFAVLFIDLDRFKVVNDSLGHLVGDRLLVGVAQRLLNCLREADLVARLGGDEFAVVLEDLTDDRRPLEVAERIQHEIGRVFELGRHTVYTSASIGIALGSAAHDRPEQLLRDADSAMYQAKAQGRARHAVYHEELGKRAIELHSLETDLRRALERDELRVHYQPVVRLPERQVAGFEALVRWQHPERGLLLPAEFIPLAEETGLVVAIDRWVMLEACRQLRIWQDRDSGGRPLTLAVNVSSRHFLQPGLGRYVQQVLRETGVDPRRLRLEITESTILQGSDTAVPTFERLAGTGVGIWLDDFGTGYSSLARLGRFPVSALKIDRSFTSRLEDDEEGNEIVRTILALARNLRMQAVAEGVETEGQLARLEQLGCDLAQGHWFAEAMDPRSASAWLSNEACWAAAS